MTVPAVVQTVILSCAHTAEGEHVSKLEEAGDGGVPGDDSLANNADPINTKPRHALVVSSSSSLMSTIAGNLVGLPTPYTGKVEEHPNNVSVDEDSEEKKRKAMDQLRKVSAYSTIACCLLLCSMCDSVCACRMLTVVSKINYTTFWPRFMKWLLF